MDSRDHGQIDLVSWDLDGTLYDPKAMRQAVARRIAVAVATGQWASARAAGRALRQHKATDRRVRSAGGGVDPEALSFWTGPLWAAFMKDFMLPSLKAIGPFPEVVSLLDEIAASGRRQIVVSDFDGADKLAALGLTDRFSEVFSGLRIGALKPHPVVMSTVLGRLDVRAERVLHVGDRIDTDIAAAEQVGMASVLVDGRFEGVRSALSL